MSGSNSGTSNLSSIIGGLPEMVSGVSNSLEAMKKSAAQKLEAVWVDTILKVEAEEEVRFEVSSLNGSKGADLKLLDGNIEIFGCELAKNKPLTLIPGTKLAAFTWQGANIEIKGHLDVYYKSMDTPMIHYLNVHNVLDYMRLQAVSNYETKVVVEQKDRNKAKVKKEKGKLKEEEEEQVEVGDKDRLKEESEIEKKVQEEQALSGLRKLNINDGVGPTILIAGSTDVGKSSLCKLLSNYAVRRGFSPTYVDLDIGQGILPGCLTAVPVESIIEPGSDIVLTAPVTYYYGHLSPKGGIPHWSYLNQQLAKTINKKAAKSTASNLRASGCIINTMGWVEDLGLELLKSSIEAFQVDIVLVVGDDRLAHSLHTKYIQTSGKTQVVSVPKSGGAVKRSQDYRRRSRMSRIRAYFYGSPTSQQQLSPHTGYIKFKVVKLYRIGPDHTAAQLNTNTISFGLKVESGKEEPLSVNEVKPTNILVNTLAAVSHAKDKDSILDSNIAGFIYLKEIDETREVITYLSPSPGQLPTCNILIGSMKWLE